MPRRPLMNSSVIIWYLPPTVRDLQYLEVNLNFLWNNFSLASFSHKLIFSFNPETVNVVYKIENIKGPACVQRQAFLLDFQPSQETSLNKSLVESAWEGGGCPQLLSRDHLWLFLDRHTACWNGQTILVVGFWLSSPDGALVPGVHPRAGLAVVGGRKLSWVGERTHHPDWARTVHAGRKIIIYQQLNLSAIFNLQFLQVWLIFSLNWTIQEKVGLFVTTSILTTPPCQIF